MAASINAELREAARGIVAEPLAQPRSGEASDGADSPTRAARAPEVRVRRRSGSPKLMKNKAFFIFVKSYYFLLTTNISYFPCTTII